MDQLSKVKLNFEINDNVDNRSKIKNNEHLVYWPASQPPPNPQFMFENSSEDQSVKLIANDIIKFESSNDTTNDEFNYFIATIDPNNSQRLICKQAMIHRMMPNYNFKDLLLQNDEINNNDQRLTKREQIDELKGKFGSKKSQRDLASRRKYEIHFVDGDADNLPTLNKNADETIDDKSVIGNSGDNQTSSQSTIIPERNENATNVQNVYKLTSIITEQEIESIKEFEREMFDMIKNDYIKELVGKCNNNSKNDDNNPRIMAIYADILLQMLQLSVFQMRKADPLPSIIGDIKKHVFERYTSTKNVTNRQQQYVLTDQNKDRILVNVFILIIMLNNYRPIDLDVIHKNCSVKMMHLKRIFELIGCYIENIRQINGLVQKCACFRLPLNQYEEPNKLKRIKRG